MEHTHLNITLLHPLPRSTPRCSTPLTMVLTYNLHINNINLSNNRDITHINNLSPLVQVRDHKAPHTAPQIPSKSGVFLNLQTRVSRNISAISSNRMSLE